MYALEDVGVWLGLDTPRFEPGAFIAFRMFASSTFVTIGRAAGEHVFALMTLVVGNRVGTKLVAGIAERVLILLRPVES